jgi:GAF domain-containing protein
LLREYLISLHPSIATHDEGRVLPEAVIGNEALDDVSPNVEVSEEVRELRAADLLYEYDETIFTRLATDLARSFDAPIALITGADALSCFWAAQCGLPETEIEMDREICSRLLGSQEILVITDTAGAGVSANDPFFKNRGIRFFAGALLKTHDGRSIGSLCVLDTRPRQITEEQQDSLASHANAVMTAIELHASAKAIDSETAIEGKV